MYRILQVTTLGRPTTSSIHTDTVPSVTCSEVENALKYMSRGNAPGPGGLVIELIKEGGLQVWKRLAALFTNCIETRTVPLEWNEDSIVLLHKKGDIKDINNYR